MNEWFTVRTICEFIGQVILVFLGLAAVLFLFGLGG